MSGDEYIDRRIQQEKLTPAELAIKQAMVEIEKLPADIRLTGAVVRLGEAFELAADFTDDRYTCHPVKSPDPHTVERAFADAKMLNGKPTAKHPQRYHNEVARVVIFLDEDPDVLTIYNTKEVVAEMATVEVEVILDALEQFGLISDEGE